MRITSKQHAQILAWSLHAYGAFQAYYLLNLIWLIGKTGKQGNIELVSPSVFAAVAVLVISFAASASICWGDRDPKVAGILFVLVALGSFPVGTILSGYVLLYLFVLWDGPFSKPEGSGSVDSL